MRDAAVEDARSVSEYVARLKSAGAMNLHSRTLVDSGEYAPEEAPEQLLKALREFARTCDAAKADQERVERD